MKKNERSEPFRSFLKGFNKALSFSYGKEVRPSPDFTFKVSFPSLSHYYHGPKLDAYSLRSDSLKAQKNLEILLREN